MSWRFSARTGWDTKENAFAAAVRQARAAGAPLINLTVSNPTECGFRYDPDRILAPLANPAALHYDPDARGTRTAREAVAAYYADHGAQVDAAHLLLTTSTSEAYSYVFRLLCDGADEVLIARPSYPLFDFLADLDDVRLRTYALFYDHGWWIDSAELERAIGPRTRAIVLVHPNNPTGHATSSAERRRLQELCIRHRLALIVDEVFLDYPLRPGESIESFSRGPHPIPTFVLSGISKIAGLPQMKVSWLAVFGPDAPKAEALGRLEIVADTFLSMNTPVQGALPTWLAERRSMQDQILDRVRANMVAIGGCGAEVLRADGGWSAVLRLPQRSGADPALELLNLGLLVHPGEFYGIAETSRVVVSLITPAQAFQEGVKILEHFCKS